MKFKEMEYARVRIEDVISQFEELISEFKAATTAEEEFAVHQKYYEYVKDFDTMTTIASIRNSINTADEFYDEEMKYYRENIPLAQDKMQEYSMLVFNSKNRDYLEDKLGKVAFKNIELDLKSFNEKMIPFMQEEGKLVQQYDKLIASAKIPFKGEEINLSGLRRYMEDTDREVRKEAYEKFSEFFETNKEELDEIYDKLVDVRTKQGKALGHDNYLPLGYCKMRRNCYDKDMLDTFRSQVKKHIVPLAEKLHEKRRQVLGLDKLSFIDEGIFFNEGNPAPIINDDELLEAGRKMYNELSTETSEFMNFMLDNELLDCYARKNKKAGGYMTFLANYKAPFIFANFNKTSGDVDVVTHECGHAFQAFVNRDDEILEHGEISMETAETHSMSMEFFAEKWMELFFGDRADDYRTMHLMDAIIFIPYGCMVDEFQHIIYENPNLTPKERKEVWLKLESEYRPHMDYSGSKFLEEGGFWQKQTHIYGSPLYYIDYCIAQLNALQFKIKMTKDFDKAWEDYMKVCKLNAKKFFTEIIDECDLLSPFVDGNIEKIVKDLEKMI
ncbi:MAG: M3 family oligoendopeptidase [Lachnospiraceae bacterium]|nr:M3 family oligoendopeptidase [Lachnospiraceae bacterium]